MRTRNHQWVDLRNGATKYGFQVYANGRWCHTHKDGKPCIYDTATERDAERAKARKLAPESRTGEGHE